MPSHAVFAAFFIPSHKFVKNCVNGVITVFWNHVATTVNIPFIPSHAVLAAFFIPSHKFVKNCVNGVIICSLNQFETTPHISTIAFQQPCANCAITWNTLAIKFHILVNNCVNHSTNGAKNAFTGSITLLLIQPATTEKIALILSQISVKKLIILLHVVVMKLTAALNAFFIPSSIPEKNPVIPLHTCLIFSNADEKKPFMPSHAAEHAFFIFSQSPIQKFLNFSDLFQRTTNAATNPAINAITIPIGFALIATFNSHCATVAPSCAVLNAWKAFTALNIILATFNVSIAVPIPVIPAITSSLLSTIHFINSLIFGVISPIAFFIPSRAPAIFSAPICSMIFASPLEIAVLTFVILVSIPPDASNACCWKEAKLPPPSVFSLTIASFICCVVTFPSCHAENKSCDFFPAPITASAIWFIWAGIAPFIIVQLCKSGFPFAIIWYHCCIALLAISCPCPPANVALFNDNVSSVASSMFPLNAAYCCCILIILGNVVGKPSIPFFSFWVVSVTASVVYPKFCIVFLYEFIVSTLAIAEFNCPFISLTNFFIPLDIKFAIVAFNVLKPLLAFSVFILLKLLSNSSAADDAFSNFSLLVFSFVDKVSISFDNDFASAECFPCSNTTFWYLLFSSSNSFCCFSILPVNVSVCVATLFSWLFTSVNTLL